MITAFRKKVKVKPGGQIEIISPDFEPGTIAEVIVLIEKGPDETSRARTVSELAVLFKTTQALPKVQTITDEEISAEIAAYRAGKV
jgi:hypothetical protein